MADEPTTAEMRHPFLSQEWTAAAKEIQQELLAEQGEVPEAPATAQSIRMNLVVTEVPFEDGSVDAHLDTSSGQIKLDLGHIEEPEVKVTLDYATAKAILVDGNFQAGMQAFMSGKVKVEGEMTKLLQLQASPTDPRAAELASRIKGITAE